MSFLLLAIVLMLSGLVAAALVIVLAAHRMLRPPRMTDGKAMFVYRRLSPGDIALHFELMDFQVRDERTGETIKIAGWWIPCPHAVKGKCAIILHNYGDAKIGTLIHIEVMHDTRYNVLAIDLRAHGESSGDYCTGGFFERDDVDQVINQLRASRPNDSKNLMLFGIGLGAGVAVAAAARRDDLLGVAYAGLFDDYRDFLKEVAADYGFPSSWILELAIRYAQFVSGANFNAIRPADLLPQLKCFTHKLKDGVEDLHMPVKLWEE